MTAQVWLVMDEEEDYGDRGYVEAVVDSEDAAQAWVDAFWAEHAREDDDDDWCTCHGKARTFDGPYGVGSLADVPVLAVPRARQPLDDMADAIGLRREEAMALLIRTAGYRAFGADGHPIDADTMAALDERHLVACDACGGSARRIVGCPACCRDCGFPCEIAKDGEGFHVTDDEGETCPNGAAVPEECDAGDPCPKCDAERPEVIR